MSSVSLAPRPPSRLSFLFTSHSLYLFTYPSEKRRKERAKGENKCGFYFFIYPFIYPSCSFMGGWAEVTCMHVGWVKDGLCMAASAHCLFTPMLKTPKIYSCQVPFSMLDKSAGGWNYLRNLKKFCKSYPTLLIVFHFPQKLLLRHNEVMPGL